MLTTTDLAQILFISHLQPSADVSAFEVRAAVDERLRACGGDCAQAAARVAQEAGDHPEAYAPRMRWALAAVADAYSPALAA
ncbi:hypothetical protein HII36_21120 [Nonomuraea sp. NN258]|uniref:hypothetical protein n=1 Tax=Nonomuraea antri TaxID=2730852 RepID=UPI00156898A9|nr:hypothetical protein [Nonomuraea antri]NRQ34334.1 hypothetical protein [Nonomuraea antri]